MTKVSLDDLRKGAPVARTERVYQLCLRLDLMAEVDALQQEWSSLRITEAAVDPDLAPPKRKGEGGNPRAEEVRQQLAALRDQLEDSTGDLRLRAMRDGEWRQWSNDHQAREDDVRDDQVAFGVCNADDLANDLGLWAIAWNGDDLAAGEWDRFFAPNLSGGDLKALVQMVVLMQEVSADPKSRLAALPGGRPSNDSAPSPVQ